MHALPLAIDISKRIQANILLIFLCKRYYPLLFEAGSEAKLQVFSQDRAPSQSVLKTYIHHWHSGAYASAY